MTTKTQYYTIAEIKQINKDKGQCFFEASTMRFFKSRILPHVYSGPGGVYFVTSEQFDEKSPRLYTVRQFMPHTGDIKTCGEFYAMKQAEAQDTAKRLAK